MTFFDLNLTKMSHLLNINEQIFCASARRFEKAEHAALPQKSLAALPEGRI
jgi:hypothetical protein